MRGLGARIVVSSDAGVRYTRFEDFALTLECGVRALGMSALEVIQAATSLAADSIGLGDEIGTIEAGKRADLLLVSGDPSQRVSDLANVARVWKDGTLMVKGGMIAPPDGIDSYVPKADRDAVWSYTYMP
jgi:imidazolonepropionase-like amidohydrolase